MKLETLESKYGVTVYVNLTGYEVVKAIEQYLASRKIKVSGPRTFSVNGELVTRGEVLVDPSGYVLLNGVRVIAKSNATDHGAAQ